MSVLWALVPCRRRCPVIREIRGPRPSGYPDGHFLAAGVRFALVALDLPDAEVPRFRTPEVEARDRRCRKHRKALGQRDSSALCRFQHAKERHLFRVIGARRVTRRGPDPLVLLLDDRGVVEMLVRGIGPEL